MIWTSNLDLITDDWQRVGVGGRLLDDHPPEAEARRAAAQRAAKVGRVALEQPRDLRATRSHRLLHLEVTITGSNRIPSPIEDTL